MHGVHRFQSFKDSSLKMKKYIHKMLCYFMGEMGIETNCSYNKKSITNDPFFWQHATWFLG